MKLVRPTIVATALLSIAAPIGVASATPQMLAAAKSAGMPAKNCQYCHTDAMPKKDTFKPETLNERGKFLLTDMQARNLKAPDMGKLKDFKEQK